MSDISQGVMLAHPYNSDKHECKGMIVSEKLDGIRGYYCSLTNKIYSRNGNEFFVPKFFLEDVSKMSMTLDGEIFIGRGLFDQLGLVRKKVPVDADWADVRYIVFDGPHLKGSFSERLSFLRKRVIESGSKYVSIIDTWVCTGPEQMYKDLENIESKKGEGLILRNDNSQYERKRSKNMLKVKTFTDAEAIVTGHIPGNGRLELMGLTGALEAEMTIMGRKTKFTVNAGTDLQRKNPPPIGSVITIKYLELTKDGNPRHPTLKCIRDYE